MNVVVQSYFVTVCLNTATALTALPQRP